MLRRIVFDSNRIRESGRRSRERIRARPSLAQPDQPANFAASVRLCIRDAPGAHFHALALETRFAACYGCGSENDNTSKTTHQSPTDSPLPLRSPSLWQEGPLMDTALDDYVIYVRSENAASLDDIEQPVASCACYEDAVRCQRS